VLLAALRSKSCPALLHPIAKPASSGSEYLRLLTLRLGSSAQTLQKARLQEERFLAILAP